MIIGKSIIAIICARGGSKGLPGKNIRSLAGKPLLAWTIIEAQRALTLDRLILSSDDATIIEVAKKFGCEVPFPRPAELATDESPVEDAVLHALATTPEDYDYVALLQPTSPLRLAEDLDGCVRLCVERDALFAFSVFEPTNNANLAYYVGSEGCLEPLVGEKIYMRPSRRRQDLPETVAPNGAVFVAHTDELRKSKTFFGRDALGYRMPRERSVDIDDELDFKIAETLLSERMDR